MGLSYEFNRFIYQYLGQTSLKYYPKTERTKRFVPNCVLVEDREIPFKVDPNNMWQSGRILYLRFSGMWEGTIHKLTIHKLTIHKLTIRNWLFINYS